MLRRRLAPSMPSRRTTSLRSGRRLQAADGMRRLAVGRIRGGMAIDRDADEFALHREMGCTREEFVRWLPGATRHAPMQMNADKAVVHAGEARVCLLYTSPSPRD